MALLFAFGSPGVGKTYVGRALQQEYQFHNYEADEDLTDEMLASIRAEQISTDAMRERYFSIVIQKIIALKQIHPNIVVTQALMKEVNRHQISTALPDTQFIHVTADINNINKRLKIRGDWVSADYAAKIRAVFEKPRLPHFEIDNNSGRQHVIEQLNTLELFHAKQKFL